jgi:hypothetical protein
MVNWSTTGGDFRVAHFLGIHAIQILPIAGWLIDWLKALAGRAKPKAFVAVSAGYVLLMGFVFMQAMNGMPLVRMRALRSSRRGPRRFNNKDSTEREVERPRAITATDTAIPR